MFKQPSFTIAYDRMHHDMENHDVISAIYHWTDKDVTNKIYIYK